MKSGKGNTKSEVRGYTTPKKNAGNAPVAKQPEASFKKSRGFKGKISN